MTEDRRPAIDRRVLLAGAAGLAGSAAIAALLPPPAEGGDSLRDRAARKGLFFGAATRADTLAANRRLQAALRRDASILVPEVELKWEWLQPDGPDRPLRFADAESIYAFARANGAAMRGHTLTWYRSEPAWATALVPTLTPGAAGDLLVRYVQGVVGHWRGRVLQWDVANEPIDGDRKLTEPLFSPKLGEHYLDLAFGAAHAADPGALLVLNTDLIEMNDPYQERHRRATLELLARLLKRGVPVGALGIEGHLSCMYGFSETIYRRFLDEVTGMGLKLMVTEFDVSDRGVLGSVAMRDAATAALGMAFLDVSLSYPQCGGVLTWAMSDDTSWLRSADGMQRADRATLRPSVLDEDYRRKPLWHAVGAALDAAPRRPGPAHR